MKLMDLFSLARTQAFKPAGLPRHVQPFVGLRRKGFRLAAGPSQAPQISAASGKSEDLPPPGATAATASAATPSAYEQALAAAGGDDSRAFAVGVAQEAWDTKAEDILVLHVAPLVYWTRYMVIATVFSKPQLNALLAKVTRTAKEVYGRELSHSVEGRSAWELLDYGDVVVHVMTAEQREYYDLEGFYGAAEEVDLPFLQDGSQQGAAWQKRLA